MFEYWFQQRLSDVEIVDRMHEIANEYSTVQIANRIELLKQRVQNSAKKLHQPQAEVEELAASVDSYTQSKLVKISKDQLGNCSCWVKSLMEIIDQGEASFLIAGVV